MAIIRLDCNLNGGDSVTPNNELFYRIYGDVDAYAAPIHTTGTALSDANVTVDNDNVIITGVDGTTNTSFKIAAVDAAFNEGVLSDSSVSSIILFGSTFNGTVIDTTEWDAIQGDVAGTVTQNNEMIVNAGGAADSNVVEAKQKIYRAAKTWAWTMKSTVQNNTGWSFQIVSLDSLTDFRVKGDTTAGQVGLYAKFEGAVDLDEDYAIDITQYQRFKYVLETDGLQCYLWNGSAWETAGSSVSGSGDYAAKEFILRQYIIGTQTTPITYMDDLYITSEDYSTEIPI